LSAIIKTVAAISRKGGAGKHTVTPFDRGCWALSQRPGKTAEEVALAMNATVAEVNLAIARVEHWKGANSREMVVAAINEQAIEAVKPLGKTLADAQHAERMVVPPRTETVTAEDGTVTVRTVAPAVYEPDYATRIDASLAAIKAAEATADKGDRINVNTGIQQNVAPGGTGFSFERLVRERREANGLNATVTQTQVDDVQDAEVVNDDDEDPDRDGDNYEDGSEDMVEG
jgi:hypothetical protein